MHDASSRRYVPAAEPGEPLPEAEARQRPASQEFAAEPAGPYTAPTLTALCH
jgi:hypothetical protein